MYTANDIGLCCGSLAQASFKELVEAASKAGFKSISIWPTLFDAALESGLTLQDMRIMLKDNGLHITELDPLMSWIPLNTDSSRMTSGFAGYSEDDFYRIADEIGGKTLNFIQFGSENLSLPEKVDLISAMCERAVNHGLQVSVEFLPFSPISNLQQAIELVEAVGNENFGVNIDTWHHFRSGGTVTELQTLDPKHVKAVQLNDIAATPWDNVIEETSTGRLMPGQGASDTVAVLHALFDAGVRVPLNIEVFSAELMALPANEVAQKLADSTRDVLAKASL